ncbi:MAG: glycoside hydrolase family 9 protein, partial [Ruminococcus sp.]
MQVTWWWLNVTEIRFFFDESGSSSGASSGGGSSISSENSTIIKFNNFNVGNGTDYTFDFGTDYANQKVIKVEIDHTNSSGAIQFKPNNNQVLQQPVSGTNTTIIDANSISDFNVGSNGTIPVTWWWVNISEIRFYFAKDTTGNNSGNTDPETPSTGGGESENTSNNTEEGAIDKDTNAPAGYVGLIAKNSPMGDKTSITVKKNWVDDTGYETLRPDKITVQLYRSTSQNLKPNELTDEMKSGDSVTIQDSNGKWEHTWTNLETKDSEEHTYYYYVKEVTDLSDYTVSYDNNGITYGDVQIKNTLKTVDISVKKDWSVPDGVTGVTNPASVTVKLQTSSDGTTWSDVSGKTLTLNSSNNWTGTFEKLPDGKYYKVVETNIPTSWTASYSDNNGNQFSSDGNITVTNTLSVASLNIKKNWEDNVGDVRPDKINIKLYRSTTPPAGSATSNSVQPISLQEPTNNYEDYSRLLQYSLYFYDAQMCGNDVKNSSDLTWRDDCHTYDNDVAGGYHDAGDHVMFGLPQGYTASTLGWSYYENKDIYDGLGQTEHYQKIMKRFCDFFVASTTLNSNNNVTNFLYQKGNGSIDHSYWGSPENQTQAQRGGLLYTTDSASDIAAEYAAALAQYAINFPNDIDKATYLNCAKALYAYSVRTNKSASVGEYTSTSYKDDQAWAAAWLYLATNEETYKTDCKNLLDTFTAIADERGYFWGDVELGAMVVYKRFIDPDYNWSIATNYLSSKCQGDSFVVLDEWGTARHNTALQMVALSASKVDGVNYTDWCKKQMNFILGDNSILSNRNSSTCFVVGFANNSAKYPHHRGASGYTNSSEKDNSRYSDNGHELVGALVGGPTSSGQYSDILDGEMAWKTNEVALDYNATLVGAAAGLFDVYHTGTLVTDASQIGTKREVKNVYLQPNPVLTVYGKSTMYKDKTQILTAENATGTVTWSSSDSGILTVDKNGLVTAVSNGKATITATDSSD